MYKRIIFILIALIVSASAAFRMLPAAQAAATLTITPVSWGVIGLDSNRVTDGPNTYMTGARICNTGSSAATNVVSTFVWDSTNTYINLAAGSSSTVTNPSLGAGACFFAYYGPIRK